MKNDFIDEKNYKVSVIVPAFNVKQYIQRCIDSLLNQSYPYIEILIIDDGSTDGTGNIVNKLYSDISNIKIFHKDNGGLSEARNYGIDRSRGQYITFVDADDYVDIHYIRHLMDMVLINGADIAIVGTQSFFDEKKMSKCFEYKYYEVDTVEAVRKMLLRDGIAHTACGKLYKSEIWQDIRFPQGLLYEDYHTTFDAFSKAHKVCIGVDKLYFYYQRPGSIMHYECNKRTASIVFATELVTPRIIKSWPELEIEALDLQTALCLKFLQTLYESDNKELVEEEREAIAIVKKNSKDILKSKKIGLKDKIKIVLLLINKKLFKRIYAIFDGNKIINEDNY